MLHIAKIRRVSHLGRWIIAPVTTAIGTLEWIGRVSTQRRALRELDDQQLKDIGLSRADALREANRPFWDVPPRAKVEGGGAESSPGLTRARRGNRIGTHCPPAALSSG